MCDKELLVEYLYDEVEPAERRAMETHLLSCAECRGELRELRSARTSLSAWAPPAPELELQVVRRADAANRRGRYWAVPAAWGLAAAAVLVLAIASAVANVEVRYGPDGFTVRAGAARAEVARAASAAEATVRAEDASLRRELEAIGQRLHDLEASRGTHTVLASAKTSAPQGPDLLRAVRQLISESEGRQEQELARRISQVLRDVESARRVDLDRTQRALAEVQGVADTTIIRQREMENHFLRVVQQPR